FARPAMGEQDIAGPCPDALRKRGEGRQHPLPADAEPDTPAGPRQDTHRQLCAQRPRNLLVHPEKNEDLSHPAAPPATSPAEKQAERLFYKGGHPILHPDNIIPAAMTNKYYYGLFFLLGISLLLSLSFCPPFDLMLDDREVFKYAGMAILRGQVPYRDFFDHK